MSTEIIYNYTVDGINKEGRLLQDLNIEEYESAILSDIELNEGLNIGGLINAGVRGLRNTRNDTDELRRQLIQSKGISSVFYTAITEQHKSTGTIHI
ncbi:hypothetical protein [Lelliottia amnigena]